jgi:RNA polymerase sigma-70 factor (ECF subfamily)
VPRVTDLIDSDAELVARLQRGDRNALCALVRRWERPLFLIAFRITGQAAEAEDVRQQVFVKLLEAPGAVREPEVFPAWIRRAVVNAALSALRQRKRRQKIRIQQTANRAEAVVLHPDEGLLAEEQARQLSGALSQLEPEARALLSLRFDQDLTFAEIAEVLDEPASTIKSRLARSVERLRGLLKTHGE